MCEGSIPSGNYSSDLRSICLGTSNMSVRSPPKTAPKPNLSKDTGRKRALEFLDTLAQSTPTKSRRLEIAEQLNKFEKERKKAVDRRYKRQQRMMQLASELHEDETAIAELDTKIRRLKAEQVE